MALRAKCALPEMGVEGHGVVGESGVLCCVFALVGCVGLDRGNREVQERKTYTGGW